MKPWKSLSATVKVGNLTQGWNLATPPSEYRDEIRAFRFKINFSTAFEAPPLVHLGLTGLDIDQRDTSRVNVIASEITKTGFTAIITTWRETRVYSVSFSWLALGA